MKAIELDLPEAEVEYLGILSQERRPNISELIQKIYVLAIECSGLEAMRKSIDFLEGIID